MRLVPLTALVSVLAPCADAPNAGLTLRDANGQKVQALRRLPPSSTPKTAW